MSSETRPAPIYDAKVFDELHGMHVVNHLEPELRLYVNDAPTVEGWIRDNSGSVFVSATRFICRRQRDMLTVFWHGLRVRSGRSGIDGAMGVFEGGSILTRTTYTLTACRSAEDR